jgi:hypothetical protein
MPGFFYPGWDAVKFLLRGNDRFADRKPEGYRKNLDIAIISKLLTLPLDSSMTV